MLPGEQQAHASTREPAACFGLQWLTGEMCDLRIQETGSVPSAIFTTSAAGQSAADVAAPGAPAASLTAQCSGRPCPVVKYAEPMQLQMRHADLFTCVNGCLAGAKQAR